MFGIERAGFNITLFEVLQSEKYTYCCSVSFNERGKISLSNQISQVVQMTAATLKHCLNVTKGKCSTIKLTRTHKSLTLNFLLCHCDLSNQRHIHKRESTGNLEPHYVVGHDCIGTCQTCIVKTTISLFIINIFWLFVHMLYRFYHIIFLPNLNIFLGSEFSPQLNGHRYPSSLLIKYINKVYFLPGLKLLVTLSIVYPCTHLFAFH